MSDTVSRKVTRKVDVQEWLVNAVMTIYQRAQVVVRTTGSSKVFDMKLTIHQESSSSSLLFVTN